MKYIFSLKRKAYLLIVFTFNIAIVKAQFNYFSPEPNSKFHNIETSIILKTSKELDVKSFSNKLISIIGSKSGNHKFTFLITKDKKTVIIKPNLKFQLGEQVCIYIKKGIKSFSGEELDSVKYCFYTSNYPKIVKNNDLNIGSLENNTNSDLYKAKSFPSITINVNNNPDEGRIFFHNISALESDNDRYYAIIENDGTPFYSKQDNKKGLSFTLQPNGYITFWNDKNFYMIDSSYNVIDSFACSNGYIADWHEFQVTNNGHAFLLAWDLQTVDMSLIVDGGQNYATVEGLIIQEFDEDKNLVFQWRSWDHFEITDAEDVDFTTSYVSYVHGNALDIDKDGNILLSSRLMNEITKIDRNTGDIIWRLGGKHNEFTFVNDKGFCRQHDIRSISNGHITLFDNGTCHIPKISKAKEYELDEINKTATLVWEYGHPKQVYSETMGNVQRLENGNTFINWGRIPDSTMIGDNLWPAITEVTSDKSIVYELTFNTFFHLIYRSYRFQWNVSPATSTTFLDDPTSIQVNLFPNPAHNLLQLDVNLKESEVLRIKIVDLNGNIVKAINKYKAVKGNNLITLDLSPIQTGFYFCIISNNRNSITKKLIISN